MPNRITRRVHRGVELLDRRFPGWADAIDTDRLDVAHGGNCVLGQLYGHFREGCNRLDISVWSAVRYGFIASLMSLFTFRWFSQSQRLTEAWIAEIRARRQATAEPEIVHDLCRTWDVAFAANHYVGEC